MPQLVLWEGDQIIVPGENELEIHQLLPWDFIIDATKTIWYRYLESNISL